MYNFKLFKILHTSEVEPCVVRAKLREQNLLFLLALTRNNLCYSSRDLPCCYILVLILRNDMQLPISLSANFLIIVVVQNPSQINCPG